MKPRASFRPYSKADKEACLAFFDANCPTFFAPDERIDYQRFLDAEPDGYEVCEAGGRVVGAFGLLEAGDARMILCWILLDPQSQGVGLGSAIMRRVISLGRASRSPTISISTSQKSAPFFARFGAVTRAITDDGWCVGLDRVDMEISL